MSRSTRIPYLVKLALVLVFFGGAILSQFVELAGRASGSVAALPVQSTQTIAEQQEFFEKKIRPIFAESCQSCHNAETKTAGLDLSTPAGFQRGGDRGPLVNKEQPESSLLLSVVSYEHALKMPPSGKLKDEQLEVLTAWVKMGAPWPGGEKPAAASAGSNWPKNSTAREFTESEKKFWALAHLALQRPRLPTD